MEKAELQKKGAKGFAAHFTKAAAMHKAIGEAHMDGAGAHDTMGMACKAMETHFTGSIKKTDGTEDELAKVQSILYKAKGGFHSAMAKMHKAVGEAHNEHADHCEACAKMAPETFTMEQPTGGKEESGEVKAAATEITKALGEMMTKFTEATTKLDEIQSKLAKAEAQPEPLAPGLHVIPRDSPVGNAAPAAPDTSGGLRKRA